MLGPFANTIFKRTYAFNDSEDWEGCAARVAKALARNPKQEKAFFEVIRDRKFIPGGRYLYSAGRDIQQYYNCLAGETGVLTAEGVRPIRDIVSFSKKILTRKKDGRPEWVHAEIRSFGIQPLLEVIIQRGKIRKSLFATANHDWIVTVDGSKNKEVHKVPTSALMNKSYKLVDLHAPSYKLKVKPSPVGIQHGIWYGDGTRTIEDKHQNHIRLCGDKNKELLAYFEPHYRVMRPDWAEGDPVVVGGPNFFKDLPSIKETSGYLLGWLMGYFAADGCVDEEGSLIFSSTSEYNIKAFRDVCAILGIGTYSIRKQERISNLTNKPSTLWLLNIKPSTIDKEFFLLSHHRDRFSYSTGRGDIRWKVVDVRPSTREEEVFCAIVPGTNCFVLEDEIVSGNCFLLRAEDSREGWKNLVGKHIMALSTGGGVGTDYTLIRGRGTPIKRFGGVASGPISLMKMVNEVARQVMAGGKRRSALWAGLNWMHSDIEEFLAVKNWSTAVRAAKEANFNFPADLDMTNISVGLDDAFFELVGTEKHVWDLYYRICKSMCKTGEPGFSVNVGNRWKEDLRNPCCEVVSDTDSDSCNLGSINLSKIEDLEDLARVTQLGVQFLYNGTFSSWSPDPAFATVRSNKRRIGLGLMGLHEWCIKNGGTYAPSATLSEWLSTWMCSSDSEAMRYAQANKDIKPIAVRAIAPTGTIGIIGETTTGIEPVFCIAYKRRFLDKDGKWKFSYVIDPTAERLIQEGINPDDIEDARILSLDVEKRIAMQAFVQKWVDQAISSTINLPEWGEPGNNNAKKFAETLLQYLPGLRGVTVYPDGARPGQPIVPVNYETAKKHKDVVYEENDETCKSGVCGA